MVFFQSFMIVIAVFVPLLQRYGLSMSQVLQTQALVALVVAAFEGPSGYLADLWGRANFCFSFTSTGILASARLSQKRNRICISYDLIFTQPARFGKNFFKSFLTNL